MRSDWSKMWRVICSNTARAKCTQIFAQKSIHSLRLETLEAAKVSSKDESYHWTPLESLYCLSVLLCSVQFLIYLVNGKWKVRVLKLQRLFIFRLQTILQTFLFGNRYRDENARAPFFVSCLGKKSICVWLFSSRKSNFYEWVFSLRILH